MKLGQNSNLQEISLKELSQDLLTQMISTNDIAIVADFLSNKLLDVSKIIEPLIDAKQDFQVEIFKNDPIFSKVFHLITHPHVPHPSKKQIDSNKISSHKTFILKKRFQFKNENPKPLFSTS